MQRVLYDKINVTASSYYAINNKKFGMQTIFDYYIIWEILFDY